MSVRILALILVLVVPQFFLGGCVSHPMNSHSDHQMKGTSNVEMVHSSHKAMMQQDHYSRSIERYSPPDLLLTDNLGRDTSLAKLLTTDKPVVVNFIYATCTTICPLLSMGYIDLQRELGDNSEDFLLVSVTIDPEHDTPEVLEAYRQKFHGRPGWTLLTGSRIDIDNVMNAFDAFFGDKMDHEPLNFVRLPEQGKWLRLNGMLNGTNFIREMEIAGIWNR